MKTRVSKIVQWAEDRKIIQNGKITTQALKLASEFGELSGNLNTFRDIKDDIGDCFVVCCILTKMANGNLDLLDDIKPSEAKFASGFFTSATEHLGDICDYAAKEDNESMVEAILKFLPELVSITVTKNIDFMECIDVAYDDIKDRKGYLNEQGCFIKEENELA